MHARYVDCRTLAHTSRVNAKPTTTNSSADTTQLANSPTQPLEPRPKAGALYTRHTTLLILISMDAGTKLQTNDEEIDDLNAPLLHAQTISPHYHHTTQHG